MMHHRPAVGAPIISAKSRRLLGHWTNRAPSIHHLYRYEFIPRQPLPTYIGDEAKASMLAPIQKRTLWLTFGNPGDQVQVWATDAETPEELMGSSWFTEQRPDGDEQAAIEVFLKSRVASILHPQMLDHVKSYLAYLTERNRRHA